MDNDSDEEIFEQLAAGCKEQGLSAKCSRQSKSEFKGESQSQSQDTIFKSPQFDSQVYKISTFEMKATGDTVLVLQSCELNINEESLVNKNSLDPTAQDFLAVLQDSQSPTSVTFLEKNENCKEIQEPRVEVPEELDKVGAPEYLMNGSQKMNIYGPQELEKQGVQEYILIEQQHLVSQACVEGHRELNNQIAPEYSLIDQLPCNHIIDEEPRSVSISPDISRTFNVSVDVHRDETTSREASSSAVSCVQLPWVLSDHDTDPDFDPDRTSCSSDDENCDNILSRSTIKTKKRKGLAEPEHWKANANKKLRQSGKSYVGWSRHENSCNTNDTPRPERQLKETCLLESCRTSKQRHCNTFTQEMRQHIFDLFWSLSWEEKQMFVINTVEKFRPTRFQNHRKGSTFYYYLKNGHEKLKVCKQMYLSTLDVGEWTVRNWVNKSDSGMVAKPKTEDIEKRKRGEQKRVAREHLNDYVEALPKLPSHYCRKDARKLYLEPIPGGMLEIYKSYREQSLEKGIDPLSRTIFDKIIKEKNIAFQPPKKDLCDTCLSFYAKQKTEEEYNTHILRKNLARNEKNKDLKEADEGKVMILEQDVQAVKICHYLRASSAYYRRKLINHNFTIYEHPSKKVRCYWFSEVNGDTQASIFVSCLLDYLCDVMRNSEFQNNKKYIVIWSDGCTYQNRNAVLANALSNFAALYNVSIYQKYLEPGHTQMEVDSVHANIERNLQKYDSIVLFATAQN